MILIFYIVSRDLWSIKGTEHEEKSQVPTFWKLRTLTIYCKPYKSVWHLVKTLTSEDAICRRQCCIWTSSPRATSSAARTELSHFHDLCKEESTKPDPSNSSVAHKLCLSERFLLLSLAPMYILIRIDYMYIVGSVGNLRRYATKCLSISHSAPSRLTKLLSLQSGLISTRRCH